MVVTIALNAFGTSNTMALVSAAAKEDDSGLTLGTASALKSLSYAVAALLTGTGAESLDALMNTSTALFLAAGFLCFSLFLASRCAAGKRKLLYDAHEDRDARVVDEETKRECEVSGIGLSRERF